MRDGFVKVAAVTPKIRVADTKYNAGVIVEGIREAAAGRREGDSCCRRLVITGYTCSDLFLQEYLLEQAEAGARNDRGGDSRGGRHPFCRSTACVQRKTL